MSVSLTPQQTMLLWTLLAEGGEAWQQDIKPPVDAKIRTALQQARLVETATRKNVRNKRALLISVTETGWAFANEHLNAPLPDKVQGAAPVLQKWLTRLHGFLQQRGVTLADLFAPAPHPAPTPAEPPPLDLQARIRSAYLRASGGALSQRVHLHALRRILSDVDRTTLDRTLVEMMHQNDLMLYGLDYRAQITVDDRQAAIEVGGDQKHVMMMVR